MPALAWLPMRGTGFHQPKGAERLRPQTTQAASSCRHLQGGGMGIGEWARLMTWYEWVVVVLSIALVVTVAYLGVQGVLSYHESLAAPA